MSSAEECLYLLALLFIWKTKCVVFVRDMERRSPDQHINGRARAERAYAKRKGPDSIAVLVRDKMLSPQSSPENSPARPARSKSPRRSAYRDPSPVYKRFPFFF